MDLLDLLQCESCKRNYSAFIQLHPAMTEEDQQILKEYTVFMEMRRLKEKQVSNFNKLNSTLYSVVESPNTLTLNC